MDNHDSTIVVSGFCKFKQLSLSMVIALEYLSDALNSDPQLNILIACRA